MGSDRLNDRVERNDSGADGYLRRLLVVGATAVLRHARKGNPGKQWAMRLLGVIAESSQNPKLSRIQ